MTSYTRDAQGRLGELNNRAYAAGPVLSDFAVPATGGYDGMGNRLSVTATVNNAPASYSGTTAYTYDYGSTTPSVRRSQVTGETSTRGGSYTNTFGYDGNTTNGPGNPTSFKGTANAFNADNQVTNTGYGYDGNGSPTSYKSSALTFDPENRLTAYGSAQTDGYSADGLRVWKQSSVGKTYFLYDGDQPVCEYSNAGTLAATNTFGADGLVSRRSVTGTPATTFYTFDERGSVSQRLDSSGSVLSTDLYDSYGSRTGTAAQPDPFGFEAQAGYYTDAETGLILCTHRFYDPATGRFLTRDPIGYGGGVNLYGYTQNNPVNREDPDGTLAPNPTPVLEVIEDTVEGVAEGAAEDAGGVAIVAIAGPVLVVGGVVILLFGGSPAGPRDGNEFGPGHYQNGKKGKPGIPIDKKTGKPVEDRPSPEEDPTKGGHRTKCRPSTTGDHQIADTRRRRDQGTNTEGGEKGDKRRPY